MSTNSHNCRMGAYLTLVPLLQSKTAKWGSVALWFLLTQQVICCHDKNGLTEIKLYLLMRRYLSEMSELNGRMMVKRGAAGTNFAHTYRLFP